jgi:hypothetical protein
MKIASIPKLLGLVAACVSLIAALPSSRSSYNWRVDSSLIGDADVVSVFGVSPRENDGVNNLVLPPRGITCGGSFNCEGGYCPPDIKVIKQIVDQIRKCKAPRCNTGHLDSIAAIHSSR